MIVLWCRPPGNSGPINTTTDHNVAHLPHPGSPLSCHISVLCLYTWCHCHHYHIETGQDNLQRENRSTLTDMLAVYSALYYYRLYNTCSLSQKFLIQIVHCLCMWWSKGFTMYSYFVHGHLQIVIEFKNFL